MNFLLQTDPNTQRLELIVHHEAKESRVSVEFVRGSLGYRRLKGGGRQEAIAKAVGLNHYPNPISVLDATAGFGQDGFILASLGCRVHLVEQSPIVGALLADGLKRAAEDPIIGPWARLITLSIANSYEILNHLKSSDYPMVVYLDPMFPVSSKSAASSLKMRILRTLVEQTPLNIDEGAFLKAARLKAQKRVVVKRPKGAPPLGEASPNFCIRTVAHRYDVYLPLASD